MIRLDNRTHRRLWAVWLALTTGSFTALEAIALLDRDETGRAEDTLTYIIRSALRNPVVWFIAAGFWVWQLLHFLLQTVPWTSGTIRHTHEELPK